MKLQFSFRSRSVKLGPSPTTRPQKHRRPRSRARRPKITWTQSYRQMSTPKTASCGCSTWVPSLLLDLMSCNCNKNLIKSCRKDKHAKLVFVPSEKICTHRLLTSWFGKPQSTVLNEGFCSCVCVTKWKWQFWLIRHCTSLALRTACARPCKPSRTKPKSLTKWRPFSKSATNKKKRFSSLSSKSCTCWTRNAKIKSSLSCSTKPSAKPSSTETRDYVQTWRQCSPKSMVRNDRYAI